MPPPKSNPLYTLFPDTTFFLSRKQQIIRRRTGFAVGRRRLCHAAARIRAGAAAHRSRARTDDGGEPAARAAAGARGLLPAPGAADHRLGPVPDAAPCPLVPVEFPASPARGGRRGLAASAEGGGGSQDRKSVV